MRIAKYLASCGLGSRRKCEELVTRGLVKVNDKTITDVATNIEPSTDKVEYAGQICEPKEKVYYLLNKPTGYTSTVADKHADKLITELVPAEPPVWPVGRLDKETNGLIILTNDGHLTQKLTHPSFVKEKEYLAKVTRSLTEDEKNLLPGGIELEDGPTRADKLEEIDAHTYKIVIHEGRNRLVRRIFGYFDSEVLELKRIRIDDLTLTDLPEGQYRELTKGEIEKLNA